jgi:hypothetical protein
MTNQLPDSLVIRQFREFLDHVETQLSQTSEEIDALKVDIDYGYAKAVGCAQARMKSLQISAKVIRQVYLNA